MSQNWNASAGNELPANAASSTEPVSANAWGRTSDLAELSQTGCCGGRWFVFAAIAILVVSAGVFWWQQSTVKVLAADQTESADNEDADVETRNSEETSARGNAEKNQAEGNASGETAQAKTDEGTAGVNEPAKPGKVPYPRPTRIALPKGVFDGGTEWLNTAGPIDLEDLRGKIVLVDFWTYCCINCIHVLPDLKYLEKKYPNELVVIGCHSAKFDNEKEAENIRNAILRYEIEHPVVNDSEMRIWRSFGIRSWPSLLVIDAEGQACALVSGEGNRDYLDDLVSKLIAYHKANDTLDATPLRFDLERNKTQATPLRFPGKVLADSAGDRLFISDSNHNRIVVTSLKGELKFMIGSGAIGRDDGTFEKATFDHPQGMALVGETLYVADTENHLIRAVDLRGKSVSTLAGTGKQATFRTLGGPLKTTALNSPWDLLVHDNVMYIAMAGPHQIWSHRLGSDEVAVFSGSGREDILDGPHTQAALAQPSGLATDGKFLYVCDSEGSAIRKIDFDPEGRTETLAGPSDLPRGRSLFEFGDIDGVGGKARFQHVLGVAYQEGTLFIADTYNHKLRTVETKTGKVSSWLGRGKRGTSLEAGNVQLNEPAGLSLAGNSLYIADTNNHRILVANTQSKDIRELKIAGLTAPNIEPEEIDPADDQPVTKTAAQTVKSGKHLTVSVKLTVPDGYKLNELAPVKIGLSSDDDQELLAAASLKTRLKAKVTDGVATVRFPLAQPSGTATFQVRISYGYCKSGNDGVCKLKSARWSLPITVQPDAEQSAVTLTVP